jgi:peptidoglycan/LPS O-acetylase OafA/YrhL
MRALATTGTAPTDRVRPPALRGRLPALDALRGLAILLVLGHHMPPNPPHTPTLVLHGLTVWRDSGWVGVDLFFVLSGFLVSGLLFREYQQSGHLRVGRFLARRGMKIYPGFIVLLIFTLVHYRHGSLTLEADRRFAAEALFAQSYFPHIWPHSWSLAVEEHFYLLLAFAVALIVRQAPTTSPSSDRPPDPFSRFTVAAGALLVLVLGLRIVTVFTTPNSLETRVFPTHLRIDSLLAGVLLAYSYHYHGAWLRGVVERHGTLIGWLSAAALAPCLVMLDSNPVMQTVGFTLLYIGFAGVLLLCVVRRAQPTAGTVRGTFGNAVTRLRSSTIKACAWLGTFSYSVYLWHIPARASMHGNIARSLFGHLAPRLLEPAPMFLIYFPASIAAGVGMARLIEMPMLAVRDRWLPSMTPAGAVAEGPGAGVARQEAAGAPAATSRT